MSTVSFLATTGERSGRLAGAGLLGRGGLGRRLRRLLRGLGGLLGRRLARGRLGRRLPARPVAGGVAGGILVGRVVGCARVATPGLLAAFTLASRAAMR